MDNMKTILLILIFGICISQCREADKKVNEAKSSIPTEAVDLKKALKDSSNFTTVQWLDSTYQDLGKVEEGQVVEVAFGFKNTGQQPLIIPDVSVGCGCTTISKKPEEPLMPGDEGVIKAKFDSKNMAGERLKEVYVSANTKEKTSHILTFRVEVVKK
jgi:hypothetical protein